MSIDFGQIAFDPSNPEPRCPCVLLLDTSASMDGAPIAELNRGLQALRDSLAQDDIALLRVELAIVTFGPAMITQDFVSALHFVPPNLTASEDTPMGSAINLALDKIEERKQTYKQNGISYYRPWVFLITDGAPTDGNIWQAAAQRVHEAERQNKITFFPVGVDQADMGVLDQISSRQALKLAGLNFREMFRWLSTSLSGVSQSRFGDRVVLPSPAGWGAV